MATTSTSEPFGPVPPDNEPGHHPPVEQDKPVGPPPGPVAATLHRFPFDFHPLFRLPALAAGVTPGSAYVDVDREKLEVRFGPWSMQVDRDDIAEVCETGPYKPWKVIGPPHLSLADRGITFGTTTGGGVCITLRRPVPGIEPTGRLKHPGLTVTVADREGLVELLRS
jgi:hypothetical protein